MTTAPNRRPQVIVIGNLIHDTVIATDSLQRDHKQWVGAVKSYCGGQGANMAATLSFLDCDAAFIGRLGDDDAGAACHRAMENAGVDMDACAIATDVATMSAYVIVETRHAARTILMNRDEALGQAAPNLSKRALQAADGIVSDGYELDILDQVLGAYAKGTRPPLFLNVEHVDARVRSTLKQADYCVMPKDIAETLVDARYANAPCRGLLSMFPNLKAVCITAGAAGAEFQERSSNRSTPLKVTPKPVTVVDTTGAGDAFMAGLVFGLMTGVAPQQALSMAHAVAEAACQTPGPRANRKRVEAALLPLGHAADSRRA